jgi:hypothetical protein
MLLYAWCLVLDLSCLTCDFVAWSRFLVVCLVGCLTWVCLGTLVPIGTGEARGFKRLLLVDFDL